jgi:hypothetical protein
MPEFNFKNPGADVNRAVDSSMLQLYQALLNTLGSRFEVPQGADAIGRVRRIVGQWGPQMYDSTDDPVTFHAKYLKAKFFKRYLSAEEFEASDKLENKANLKYLNTILAGHKMDAAIREDEDLRPLFNHMKATLRLALGEFDLMQVYKGMKHGPNGTGSVMRSEAYPHVKDADLTGTRSSLQQYWHYLRWNTLYREHIVDTRDDYRAFVNALDFSQVNVVDCNHTLQVPKEWDTLRTMNPDQTVPSQFAQGVAEEMTKALFRVGIDLETQQETHRNLAKFGSLYPEANIATLDWSEASNRIWLAICDEVIEEDWMRFIKACCRTPMTGIDFKFSWKKLTDKGRADFHALQSDLAEFQAEFGKDSVRFYSDEKKSNGWTNVSVTVEVLSSMVATMGNPITFPLQTLVFYAFLAACSDFAALRLARDPQEGNLEDMFVSCFGDDGICSTRAIPEVHYFAKKLGWVYNDHKSFSSGGFRESCGGDYYRGVAVRPVMLKRPPITRIDSDESIKECKLVLQAWSYIAANAVSDCVKRMGHNDILIQQWLVDFHRLFQLGNICLVPPSFPDGSGFRVALKSRFMFRNEHFTLDCDVLPEIVEDMNDDVAKHCHLPFFDVFEKRYRFRALISVPRRLMISDQTPYYKFAWLQFTDPVITKGTFVSFGAALTPKYRTRGRYISLGSEIHRNRLTWRPQKGFFDTSDIDVTRLDQDGTLPIKECRLRKKVSTVLSWDYWLPSIFLK